MITRSTFRSLRAAALAVALLSFGAPITTAHASTPTQPQPGQPSPSDGSDASTPDQDPNNEFVESWTITPGGSADGTQPSNRPNLSYQVAPGTVIDDTVTVYNLGNLPMDFRVYATDAYNNEDGDFALLAGDEVPVDVGSWVTLGQEGIVLPPGKQATIPLTIKVPVDATPGDHVGGIVASNVAVSDNGDGQVVNVDRRTATRMYIQVNGELMRELAVTNLTTKYHQAVSPLGGSAGVSFRVENRGNVRLGGTPRITISGPLGVGKITLTLPSLTELLPGEDVTLHATLENAPALFLGSTKVQIIPADQAQVDGVKEAIGRDRFFAPPLAAMVAIVLVLLIILIVRMRRRRLGVSEVVPVDDFALTKPAEREAQLQ
jgi:hypothetical protein